MLFDGFIIIIIMIIIYVIYIYNIIISLGYISRATFTFFCMILGKQVITNPIYLI